MSIRFWCTQEFLLWEDNRLVAHYQPGLGYNCVPGRPGHDRLQTLLFGGTLGQTLPVFVEDMQGNLTKYEAGAVVPGWINESRMSLVAPAGQSDAGGSIGGQIKTGGQN